MLSLTADFLGPAVTNVLTSRFSPLVILFGLLLLGVHPSHSASRLPVLKQSTALDFASLVHRLLLLFFCPFVPVFFVLFFLLFQLRTTHLHSFPNSRLADNSKPTSHLTAIYHNRTRDLSACRHESLLPLFDCLSLPLRSPAFAHFAPTSPSRSFLFRSFSQSLPHPHRFQFAHITQWTRFFCRTTFPLCS